ncbi:hypothetical protein NC652_034339 [Populus alba x Populus x berolinensis]|nr:hypothetical protein NC652_034339 [Populus alba x Populus x berolinensis]
MARPFFTAAASETRIFNNRLINLEIKGTHPKSNRQAQMLSCVYQADIGPVRLLGSVGHQLLAQFHKSPEALLISTVSNRWSNTVSLLLQTEAETFPLRCVNTPRSIKGSAPAFQRNLMRNPLIRSGHVINSTIGSRGGLHCFKLDRRLCCDTEYVLWILLLESSATSAGYGHSF